MTHKRSKNLQNLPVQHWAQNLSEFLQDFPQCEQNIV